MCIFMHTGTIYVSTIKHYNRTTSVSKLVRFRYRVRSGPNNLFVTYFEIGSELRIILLHFFVLITEFDTPGQRNLNFGRPKSNPKCANRILYRSNKCSLGVHLSIRSVFSYHGMKSSHLKNDLTPSYLTPNTQSRPDP